jgi:hypothetical protein
MEFPRKNAWGCANEDSRILILALETWLREQRAKLSAKSEVAKAIHYSLTRWTALTRFLDDGRLCMFINPAERALRCRCDETFIVPPSSSI